MEIDLDAEAHLDDPRAAFRVEVDLAGARLEEVVGRRLGVGLVEVRRLFAEGRVRVDGRAWFEPRVRAALGARVVVLGGAADPSLLGERIPLPVLWRGADVLCVDKPARLAMYPGDGHPAGTIANALRGLGVPLSSHEGPLRPGIVHRLDRGTSGCLLVALTDDAHVRLKASFVARRVRRCYLALVAAAPPWDERTIDAPMGRGDPARKSQIIRADGRPAVTHVRVVERFPGGAAMVECRPETGRTHQIRVHLASVVGTPILGDTLYGGGSRAPRPVAGIRRAMLHAARVACEEEGIAAEAPMPEDFAAVVRALRSFSSPA